MDELVECRVLLSQETVDDVHRLGGSLQYAIEDGLRVWLFAAHIKEGERLRRSVAAKQAAMTRTQRRLVEANPMKDPSRRWLTLPRSSDAPR